MTSSPTPPAAAAAAAPFEIVVERAGVEVQRFTLTSGSVTIGRTPSADVQLDDRSVSRLHARLVVDGRELRIIDLNSQNGIYLEGRRVEPGDVAPREAAGQSAGAIPGAGRQGFADAVHAAGGSVVERGARIQLGAFVLRRVDTAPSKNVALEEQTGPDAGAPAMVEVLDQAALDRALPHIRIGRHFVFIDDAQAVLAPTGRMNRLLGHRAKRGRVVKPLADAAVDVAGARIHPVPLQLERLAAVVCDRDLYRAEQDVVRLLVTMPGGGGSVKLRITHDNVAHSERDVDVSRGIAIETLAMLLPGAYAAQLVVDGCCAGEPARFTVAQYTLAPLSARLLEQRLDRAAGTLSVTLAVESYGVAWDRPLTGALVESGREMSDIAFTMERAGLFTGKARVVAGDGPFRVRIAAADDAGRVAEVALPGTRRKERTLTLAGELGKELHVSLLPEPGSLEVRGLHLSHGDFIGTPVVVDDVVGERVSFRAQEDIESLVVVMWDATSCAFSVYELGDVDDGKHAELTVPKPLAVAFVGCFVNGEPFEAFTTLFAPERAVSLEVPDVVAPGAELAVTFRVPQRKQQQGPQQRVPMLVCIRDERLTQTDAPLTALAAATKRLIASAGAGLGDDFSYTKLEELLPTAPEPLLRGPTPAPAPTVAPPASTAPHSWAGLRFLVRQRDGSERVEDLSGRSEINVGRMQENDVVLPMRNISKRHARFVLRDGKLILVDLKSTNGTFVNGRRLGAPQIVKPGDKIYLGDFTIEPQARPGRQPAKAPAPSPAREGKASPMPSAPASTATLILDAAPAAAVPKNGAGRAPSQLETRPAYFSAAQADVDLLAGGADDDEDLFEQDCADDAPAAPAAAPCTGAGAVETSSMRKPPPPAPSAQEPDERAPVRVDAIGEAGASRGGDGAGASPAASLCRATFPEVLFCGLVDVGDGDVLRVPAGDSLGAFAVEVFWTDDDGDFGAARARVCVDKAVRVDVDIAPEIDPEDRVQGTLRVAARGSARVSLLRDGRSIPLRHLDGRPLGATDAVPSGTELVFDAAPGTWLAQVEDASLGTAAPPLGASIGSATDAMEVRIGAPGVYRALVREVVLLEKGKRLSLTDDMLALRVLPGIDEPFQMLAEATAGYAHLCCEQSAAKIVSGVVMLLTTDNAALRRRGEDVVVAGIARERAMFRPGRGFALYPDDASVSSHYTPRVVRSLWSLEDLADLRGLSPQLLEAVREGLAMAADAAGACSLKAVPSKVESIEDAWLLALREPRRQRESLEHVARTIAVDESGARVKATAHVDKVSERATLSYAAAILFACGKVQAALRIANDVLRQLNEHGRLYSTVDSVAAIALMVQLRKTGVCAGGAELLVNGVSTTAARAAEETNDAIESVDVIDGVAVIEVSRVRELRWAEQKSSASFPLRVAFVDARSRQLITKFRRGDKAELVVTLPKGYVEGDALHVCLPPAMAWLEGGGRVKRFSVDFAGRDEVRVPVVVTGAIHGRQRFAVAVRNMFQEERAASPGLMVIEPT